VRNVPVAKKDESGDYRSFIVNTILIPKSGMPGSERKGKRDLHWVNINDCLPCEVRLYDRLFMVGQTCT